MKFKNLTPHNVVLNNGTSFPSEGVARVQQTFTEFDENQTCDQQYGEVENLPDPAEGVTYIVSLVVLTAVKGKRYDCVAPASGHKDVVRDAKGQIASVPGFVR